MGSFYIDSHIAVKTVLLLSNYFSSSHHFPLTSISDTMSNRSGETRRPGLVSDLRRKVLSLSPLTLSAIDLFINILHQVEDVQK